MTLKTLLIFDRPLLYYQPTVMIYIFLYALFSMFKDKMHTRKTVAYSAILKNDNLLLHILLFYVPFCV